MAVGIVLIDLLIAIAVDNRGAVPGQAQVGRVLTSVQFFITDCEGSARRYATCIGASPLLSNDSIKVVVNRIGCAGIGAGFGIGAGVAAAGANPG